MPNRDAGMTELPTYLFRSRRVPPIRRRIKVGLVAQPAGSHHQDHRNFWLLCISLQRLVDVNRLLESSMLCIIVTIDCVFIGCHISGTCRLGKRHSGRSAFFFFRDDSVFGLEKMMLSSIACRVYNSFRLSQRGRLLIVNEWPSISIRTTSLCPLFAIMYVCYCSSILKMASSPFVQFQRMNQSIHHRSSARKGGMNRNHELLPSRFVFLARKVRGRKTSSGLKFKNKCQNSLAPHPSILPVDVSKASSESDRKMRVVSFVVESKSCFLLSFFSTRVQVNPESAGFVTQNNSTQSYHGRFF